LDGNGVGDACTQDLDNDGVPNGQDNCPYHVNPGQRNRDATSGDGLGDACDDDIDGDGLGNNQDPCPFHAQTTDTDGDGVHDACDPDDDNDAVPDRIDLMPRDPDLGADQDGDGQDDRDDPCPCSPEDDCWGLYDLCNPDNLCPRTPIRDPWHFELALTYPDTAMWEALRERIESAVDIRYLKKLHRDSVVNGLRSTEAAEPLPPRPAPPRPDW
jgi:hypothetical protein